MHVAIQILYVSRETYVKPLATKGRTVSRAKYIPFLFCFFVFFWCADIRKEDIVYVFVILAFWS